MRSFCFCFSSLDFGFIQLKENWVWWLQDIFERFDRDRSGKIDTNELREALLSLGFAVSPVVLDLLVSKFDKTGGKQKAIEYDNFIEYDLCLPCSVSLIVKKHVSFLL